MQSLQHQTEETKSNYSPAPPPTEPGVIPVTSEATVDTPAVAHTPVATVSAPLSVMSRVRRELTQRDRYHEISQALERELKESAERQRYVEEIMEQLLRETQEARQRRQRQMFRAVLLALFLVAAYFRVREQLFHFWWMVFPLSGLMAADRLAYKRRDAARKLWEASDPRAVGVLAVTLRDHDPAVREVAEKALLKLLPRVLASHASSINADQMNALLSIAYREDEDLKLALLQALEQIGDVRAIPAVREMQLYGSFQVREQAARCMPFLEERVRRSRESVTLLRAADINATAPEELLRPATDQVDTPPEQLLRPTSPQ
ncbi:MAG TPA: hypothetical protein VKU00_18330 [Chthonomonadaceae bacterium]|nr:hypothetical protein [Chthonomonadaceae bacterium]